MKVYIFVIGCVGIGKLMLFEYFLWNIFKNFVIVVFIGVVVFNVGGQIIYLLFWLLIGVIVDYMIDQGFEVCKFFNVIDILVIDEVLMVNVDLMDVIDCFLCQV